MLLGGVRVSQNWSTRLLKALLRFLCLFAAIPSLKTGTTIEMISACLLQLAPCGWARRPSVKTGMRKNRNTTCRLAAGRLPLSSSSLEKSVSHLESVRRKSTWKSHAGRRTFFPFLSKYCRGCQDGGAICPQGKGNGTNRYAILGLLEGVPLIKPVFKENQAAIPQKTAAGSISARS
jgi:hypothetical protein